MSMILFVGEESGVQTQGSVLKIIWLCVAWRIYNWHSGPLTDIAWPLKRSIEWALPLIYINTCVCFASSLLSTSSCGGFFIDASYLLASNNSYNVSLLANVYLFNLTVSFFSDPTEKSWWSHYYLGLKFHCEVCSFPSCFFSGISVNVQVVGQQGN